MSAPETKDVKGAKDAEQKEEHVARVISGKKISEKVHEELKAEVEKIKKATGQAPNLAVVLVGARKDSQTYVRMKTKACEKVGIGSEQHDLAADAPQAELEKLIQTLNADAKINGILVQLPLPEHMDAEAVLALIDPKKDVDGLHQINNGDLFRRGTRADLIPCTPLGCIRLLDEAKVKIEGANAVVVGRSALVGKPVAMLLLSRNATVTVCHSRTANLAEVVGGADIVIAAVGRAQMVKAAWLKKGCTVIDVGINAVDDSTRKRGYRLVGDVEYKEAKKICGAITPVPGGVGPMTVAMLLKNTTKAFYMQHAK
jgi:5,10-methylene-tetrahydrofolate dehydrogenase/methenyl tetrahydrofolate cyclohydrolase